MRIFPQGMGPLVGWTPQVGLVTEMTKLLDFKWEQK